MRWLLFSVLLSPKLFGGAVDFVGAPMERLDLRWKMQELIDRSTDNQLILRGDTAFKIKEEWLAALRLDVRYVWLRSHDHVTLVDEFGEFNEFPSKKLIVQNGLGDTLAQLLFIRPKLKNWTLSFGSQVIFPTASHAALGSGKYISLPTVGFKYEFEKAWLGMLVRYASDFAGRKSAPHFSNLVMQPNVHFNITKTWYLHSDPDIIYNFMDKKWFVPINLMLGTVFVEHWAVFLRYSKGIITDNPIFEQEVFIRFGYLF